ncbi:MAG: tetratricopeptide repeat protein [Candidatus Omnitrophica bacterium]|nr:tetratricopeptide repeat protein [Candidatus Omnitrophota bacterium]
MKMAGVYRKDRDYAHALEAYQNALTAGKGLEDINDAQLQFNIADVNDLLNSREKAVEEYLKLVYLYPKETGWVVKAYLAAARIFEDDEKWSEARTTYEKVVRLGTDELKFAQERIDWINEHILKKNE